MCIAIDGSFRGAVCIVREGDSALIDLTLTVPDEATAAGIRRNWDKKHAAVYAYLMEELL